VAVVSKLRRIGGIASLALLLGACDASVFAVPRDHRESAVVPSPPTVLDFVDPAGVPGLGVETIASDRPYVHVTYPTLTHAPDLGRGLRAWLSGQVREHLAAVPASSTATEFNVDWRLTAASGGVVGVRLRLGRFSGGGWTHGFRTLWHDGALHPSTDLLRPDAVAELAALTRRIAVAERTGIAAGLIPADPELFDSLNFNRRGDLVVELDDPRIVPALMGRAAIVVPAADAAPLLSDLGRRVQAVVREAARRATAPPTAGPPESATSPEETAAAERTGAAGSDRTEPEAAGSERTGSARNERTESERTGAAGDDRTEPEAAESEHAGSARNEPEAAGTQRTGAARNERNGPVAAGTEPAGPGTVASSGEPPTDCAKVKCVALTFDDGPGPYTAEILKIMSRYRACGTFFAVGVNAAARPDLVRRVHDACGLVATHTWSHRNLAALPPAKLADQINRGRQAVTAATGDSPALLLPPYGREDGNVPAITRELGVTLVRPDVDAGDGTDPADVAAAVLAGVGRNAIVLMHETRTTVKALPRILNELNRRGYTFVTIPHLRK
jgi:peptidoglycan/xylan/chitin deacetylase (PgdA/CDA1 family)